MTFRLTNAPATFEMLMEIVLPGLSCLENLDDFIVMGQTFSEHLLILEKVHVWGSQANLKLPSKKCNLFRTEVKFLGHIVSREGVTTDVVKVKALKGYPLLKLNWIEEFSGTANLLPAICFHALWLPNHKTSHQKRGGSLLWDDRANESFNKLMQVLCLAPVVACPQMFIADTDLSENGVSGVLSQREYGNEK